jgi:hypothetical protein
MARSLSSNKVFHELNTWSRLDDGTSSGALDAAASKGDSTIDLGTGEGAGFEAGDIIRIGANGGTASINTVTSVATDTLTLDDPLARDYAATTVVQELSATELGALDENGVQFNVSSDETEVLAGTQKDVYLYIAGAVGATMSYTLRDFESENLAEILGIDDTTGDNVHSGGFVGPLEDVASRSFLPYMAEGVLEDATAVVVYFWAVKVAAADAAIQLAHGTPSVLQFNGRAVSGFSVQIG